MSKSKDVNFPNTNPAYLIASWFWVGKLQPSPGTWGTLAALPLWAPLLFAPLWVYLSLLFTLFLLGSWAIEHIEKNTNRKKTHDSSVFVIDEVVGLGLTLLPLFTLNMETLTLAQKILYLTTATLLFRVFDIWKPQPVKYIDQKIHNGLGVVLDDVMAALYAATLLTLIIHL